jgi:hypothetical protein
MNPVYLETARLMAQVAPLVFVDDAFALKGGTAINLFVRDIRHDYARNLQGMTADAVPLEALLATRERLVQQIQRELDDDERRFLLALVRGEPEWGLLGIAHLEHLPGVRWKLQNLKQLQKTNARKFAAQAEALIAGFESVG